MPRKPKNYNVGYGKPPAETQFTPGTSGNPRGRPKGSLNLSAVVERILRERVVINENGRRVSITKLEAFVKHIVHKAASGDLNAAKQLVSLVLLFEDQGKNSPSIHPRPSESDEKVFASIMKRLNKSTQGEPK
jgi:Family of unknown function (DUF5681)